MNRRIMLIIAAVVLALFGTTAVYTYAHNADSRAVAGQKAAKVLIATQRIAAGTTWTDATKSGALTVENMPADTVPSSALSGLSGVGQTAVALGDITPGQVVLRESFGTQVADTGALTIPKGLVAVSVSLPADANVAGFVGPSSQVSVFLTSQLSAAKGGSGMIGTPRTGTETLLPRVPVIATSQTATATIAGKTAADASMADGTTVLVTLALTQHQAEQVILAQHVGQLYLALLSDTSKVGDDAGVDNTGEFAPTQITVK